MSKKSHGSHISSICLQRCLTLISTLLIRNSCAATGLGNIFLTPNPDCCQRVSRGTLLSSTDCTLLATSLVRALWWDGALRALVPTAIPQKELLWLFEHAPIGKKRTLRLETCGARTALCTQIHTFYECVTLQHANTDRKSVV